MSSVIYTRIPACDPALVAEAKDYGMADLHESIGAVAGHKGLMHPRMRALNPGLRISGQAVTAHNYPGDNLMIHKAMHVAEAGQVLVLTNGGAGHAGALWGEVAATYAMHKGIAGIIVDGSIRDIDALRKMNCPVWSTAISASHPEKRGPGSVNVPVVCAGVTVNPGDVIVADDDGVLVISRDDLGKAVAGAKARAEKEREVRKKIAEGVPLFDILGMQRLIDAAGIEQREGTWSGE